MSVALLRQGDATPVARFTTFLTYQEPHGPVGADGPLRVGLVAPVLGASAPPWPTRWRPIATCPSAWP